MSVCCQEKGAVDSLPCQLTARGVPLDGSPQAFGELHIADHTKAHESRLREQLNTAGYLYLPGFFPREEVKQVRASVCGLLDEQAMLHPDRPTIDCIPRPALSSRLAAENGSSPANEAVGACRELNDLIYGDRVMSFYERLFSQAFRHYDYTWFRAVAPGLRTVPHCDIVYMGRGTRNLYTMWTPLGDIPLEMGGLMLLEASSSAEVQSRLSNYTRRDVDEYCSDRPLPQHVDLAATTDNKVWNGWLARNPASLRKNLGGRWLTTEFAMGDVIILSVSLVHASLDNHTDRFRLSCDSRYQPTSEPIDDRFVDRGPIGHVGSAKRGRVC